MFVISEWIIIPQNDLENSYVLEFILLEKNTFIHSKDSDCLTLYTLFFKIISTQTSVNQYIIFNVYGTNVVKILKHCKKYNFISIHYFQLPAEHTFRSHVRFENGQLTYRALDPQMNSHASSHAIL